MSNKYLKYLSVNMLFTSGVMTLLKNKKDFSSVSPSLNFFLGRWRICRSL